VSGNEPPEDPSEAPTGYYDYGSQEEGDPQRAAPWYRRPIITLTLGLFAAILLGIALYLLADRTQGTGGTTPTPTSPTTPTVAPTTSAGVTTTTEPVAPSETTTTSAPAPAATTSVDEGHHHHHHHDGGTP
jgi:hypothetical protein